MTEPAVFVGIDVSKDRLDVAARPGPSWSCRNDPDGIAALAARLAAAPPALIVLEATGGLEAPAAAALAAAGLPVAVVNPRQARDFAKAVGRLAKGDRLDAAVLAHFAEAVRPAPRPLPEAEARALDALLTRRRQLLEMLTMERQRRAGCAAAVRADLEANIAWLAGRLAGLERELAEAIERSPAWRAKDELLRGIPGIGPVTSRSWAAWAAAGRRRWPGWRRTTTTAGGTAGRGTSPGAGPTCDRRCTWRRWRRGGTTRC